MILAPLFNNVLLQRVSHGERKTDAGLVLPDNMKDEGTWRAKILAVGPGIVQDGFLREPPKELQLDVEVYVPAFQGYKTQVGKAEFLLVKDTEILAVVKDEKVSHNGQR